MSKVIAVIHHLDDETTLGNAGLAEAAGAAGVALIQMEGRDSDLYAPLRVLRARYPKGGGFLIGSNQIGTKPAEAIEHDLSLNLDFSWVDNPGVSSAGVEEDLTASITHALQSAPDTFLFFGSVAFKTQRPDPFPAVAAVRAAKLGWIPTTSGRATGVAPDCEKLRVMKNAIDMHPLALASGVTPENVESLAPFLDYIFVATGVSSDFFHFDVNKLRAVVQKARAPKAVSSDSVQEGGSTKRYAQTAANEPSTCEFGCASVSY